MGIKSPPLDLGPHWASRLFAFQFLGWKSGKKKQGISILRQAFSPRRSLAVAQIKQILTGNCFENMGVYISSFLAFWLFVSHSIVDSEVMGCCCSFSCSTDMHQNHTKNKEECMWGPLPPD